MNYWAIDDKNLSSKKQLVIDSRMNVAIENGDEIVLFERNYEDIRFHTQAIITRRQRKESKHGTIQFSAEIENSKSIDNPPLLSELTYSLLKIYRYDKPDLHFQRTYLSLCSEDFGAIVTASIYWARTAFGFYINALRKEQFVRFLQNVAQFDNEILLQGSDFGRSWKALRKFIEEEYIATGNLLKAIHSRIDQLRDINLNYFDIGLSSDNENTNDLLYEQEELFNQFLEITQPETGNVLYELSRKIDEESKSESEFQEIFGGEGWPLYAIRE